MKDYQIVDKKDRRKLAEFLAGEGEVLLPLLEMLETAEASVNAAIDVIGRAGIEALLMLSKMSQPSTTVGTSSLLKTTIDNVKAFLNGTCVNVVS